MISVATRKVKKVNDLAPKTVRPDDVREQLERLKAWKKFRGRKLRLLLIFLVEESLANRQEKLTLNYIGESLNDEPLTFEEASGRWSYPKTRANLVHVRNRLMEFHQGAGHRDRVVIKLNPGAYAPVIEYNTTLAEMPDLEPGIERLILRAKAAIDTRTVRGATLAMECYDQIPQDWSNPRQAANRVFLQCAAAPLFPGIASRTLSQEQRTIDRIKASGVETWECTFAEACLKACCRHEWKKALGLFEVAIRNSLDEAKYYWWYTALLAALNRVEEAIGILEPSVRHFSRTNLGAITDLANLQVLAGRFQDAEAVLLASLDFARPNSARLAFSKALVFEAQDRLEDAAAALEIYVTSLDLDAIMAKAQLLMEGSFTPSDADELFELSEGQLFLSGMHILILGRMNETALASMILAGFQSVSQGRMPSVEMAFAMIGLGRYDEAVEWLRRAAFVENDPYAMWFHIFPPLRHLRGHKGYRQLLKELNLPLQRSR